MRHLFTKAQKTRPRLPHAGVRAVASARGGVRRQAGDNGTREMIDKILLDEERHIDWAGGNGDRQRHDAIS